MRQFAVIGLGRFGYSVAETLIRKGAEVLAIDRDEEKVQKISDIATFAVAMDATDEKGLKSIGIQNVDVAVVSIGEDIESSVLAVMILKELGVKEIVAKAITDLHARILVNLGVSKVIFPEREMGRRLANSLVMPTVHDFIQLSEEYSIAEIPAPKEFQGKSLKEIGIRARYNMNVLAIRRKVPTIEDEGETSYREETIISPSADDKIEAGDVLVVLGENRKFQKLSKLI
ncbi:MAG: TrkA family potassium uptake protein [Deltaproteobacteria bacterium]|nr:MAG: TrkA family potassium uptake protein [Deltaproteobacteria bacterium]